MPHGAVLSWPLVFFALLGIAHSVHVSGTWDNRKSKFQIITKFGFQQTSKLEPEISRGYIYGNVTADSFHEGMDPLLFIIVRQAEIGHFYTDSAYGLSCAAMLNNITEKAFESRCFTDSNRGDRFRWIPCPEGKLCVDEDNPAIVLPGHQLTLQIEEPTIAEYWYVVLASCHLDANCTWQSSADTRIEVQYDLWLTNGHPFAEFTNPMALQFSFDEQDSTQMYLITLVLYIFLCGLLYRAKNMKSFYPSRLRLLAWIVYLKTAGVALQSANMLLFAIDGEGLAAARFLGELFRIFSVDLLCLILILLARGWCFTAHKRAVNQLTMTIWSTLCTIHIVLFFCNFIFIFDILHDVDIFTAWPGYGMLAIRILFALWFLLEVRVLIRREQTEEKAVFLAHFGAGFLVWFVYLPGLGVVASFISVLWRFKIILGITTLANFSAISCLLHLFWPNSQHRKYFAGDLGHRRASRADSTELQDFEKLLFECSDNEDSDPCLSPQRQPLHSI